MSTLLPRERTEVSPGAVHVPDWLTLAEQRQLVVAAREWAKPPAPMRHTRMPNGTLMSARTVCLGWHWQPYRYLRTADDTDGAPVPPVPEWLVEMGRRAVLDTCGIDGFAPDAALINHYADDAVMGLHQDKDEVTLTPVVSFSIGDTCRFRFGNAERRGQPYADVELMSGDLFVFGGPARLAYHGVVKILAGTGDPATGLGSGRLNITLRETGLT